MECRVQGGPYKPPDAPTKIATLDLEFDALNEADVTFTEATTGTSKRTKAKTASNHITPQFDKHGHYIYPSGYRGIFEYDIDVNVPDVTTTERHLVTVNIVLEPTLPPLGAPPQTSHHYHVKALDGGQVTAHLMGTLPGCAFNGSGDFPLNASAIDLEITQDASYILKYDLSYVILQAILTCPDSPSPVTPVPFVPANAKITLPKHAINDRGLLIPYSLGIISRLG